MNKIVTLMMAIKNYYPYFFLPLILLYLLFNIFDGNNGLLSHSRLNAEIANLEAKVKNILLFLLKIHLQKMTGKRGKNLIKIMDLKYKLLVTIYLLQI